MGYYILSATLPTQKDPEGGLKWAFAEYFETLEKARTALEKRARKQLRSLTQKEKRAIISKDKTEKAYFERVIWADTPSGGSNGWHMHINGMRYGGIVSTNPEDARTDYDDAAGDLDTLYFKNVFDGKRGKIPGALLAAIKKHEPRMRATF